MNFKTMTASEYRALSADALEQRRQQLINASEDGDAITTEQLRSEAALIKAEMQRRRANAGLRSMASSAVAKGAGNVIGAQAALAAQTRTKTLDETDDKNSLEYRHAFMDYVMRSVKADTLVEHRADATTLSTDVAAVLPPDVVNQIIEKAESYGMILPLVTQTNYAAGVEIPLATLRPEATWVAEGATSDKQKYTTDKVVFTHHKLRIEISISMEVSAMALSVFETKLVETVARAIVKAKEQAILTGTGTGQPKGILTETAPEGQAISVKSGAGLTYETLVEAEAALPQEYEAGAVWFMSKKSFMAFVGMTDSQGQPIAQVNYGLGGVPERTLLGRTVVLTGDYLPSYSKTPSADTTFACIFRPTDYVMNSVFDMGVQKRQDWDTEDVQTKAVTACDGKVADVNSLVTLTVTKASA